MVQRRRRGVQLRLRHHARARLGFARPDRMPRGCVIGVVCRSKSFIFAVAVCTETPRREQKSITSFRSVLIDLILEGSLRLMGPASKGGLIVEHLTRSTPEEKCYVWFSLSNKTHKEPIMVDLAEPIPFEGHHRFPLKANGKLFITLGPGV
jgi:hypothetical protein